MAEKVDEIEGYIFQGCLLLSQIKAQELSEERKSRWISGISRDDLTEEIVCSKSILFREEQLRAGISVTLTKFRHCSWDTKKLLIEQTIIKEAAEKQSERARKRELVKKPTF